MKVITLSSLVVLFAIASMVTIAPNAFADHSTATVTNANIVQIIREFFVMIYECILIITRNIPNVIAVTWMI